MATFNHTGAFKNPEDFLRYKTREKKVLDELKIHGEVRPETLESYLESEKVNFSLESTFLPGKIGGLIPQNTILVSLFHGP